MRVRGGLEEEVHVLLDDDALRRTGLSIQAVIDRLRQENINVAGGTIQEGRTEYMVRTLNEYRDLREIGETVVASREGRDVRVQDLEQVLIAHKEREMLTRTDGSESVQVDVFKEADADVVAVADRVRAALGDAEKEGKAETRAPPAGERGGRAEPVGLGTRLLREEGARLQIVTNARSSSAPRSPTCATTTCWSSPSPYSSCSSSYARKVLATAITRLDSLQSFSSSASPLASALP